MGSTTEILSVARLEADKASAALTSGFIADPVMRWIYPEAHSYIESFPKLLCVLSGTAFEDGTAYATDDYSGAALWLSPGKKGDEEGALNLIEETVRSEIREDLYTMLAETDTYHPDDAPCWYLPFIGVDAARQGQGLGSALMKHALDRCDEEGIQAYLESSNPANMSLYERHGFQVMGRIDAGSAPPVHPMIRRAR